MSQTYTIEKVSTQVRDFTSKYGAMKAYKLKLSGVELPVELTKKVTSPAPAVGDTLFGSIDMSAQYGPKFVVDRSQFTGGGSGAPGSSKSSPKDEKAIQAMWAIGQASQFLSTSQGAKADIADIEPLAGDFFAMVDRVKSSGAEPEKDTVINDVPEGKPTLEDVFGDVEVIETDDF